MVISVIGADRAGLVDALSGAVADNGGNWERSHLTELAGVFAGVVLVRVPDDGADGLAAALEAIEGQGLLHVSLEEAAAPEQLPPSGTRLQLSLVGQDHPGIVHEISHALAERRISIDDLETEVVPAPMGGSLFQARAVLDAPADIDVDDVRIALEALAHDLMVDLDVAEETAPT